MDERELYLVIYQLPDYIDDERDVLYKYIRAASSLTACYRVRNEINERHDGDEDAWSDVHISHVFNMHGDRVPTDEEL